MKKLLIYALGLALGLVIGFGYIGTYMDSRGIGSEYETYISFFGFFGTWVADNGIIVKVPFLFAGLGLFGSYLFTRLMSRPKRPAR